MLFHLWQRLVSILIAVAAAHLLAVSGYAQTVVPKSEEKKPHGAMSVYEDDQVRIVVPADWTVVTESNPRLDQFAELGRSITSAKGKLLLKKTGYTLGIAYDTEQTSGIIGGRLIEILSIPWPIVDDEWSCIDSFKHEPQPASRELMFVNLIVDSGGPMSGKPVVLRTTWDIGRTKVGRGTLSVNDDGSLVISRQRITDFSSTRTEAGVVRRLTCWRLGRKLRKNCQSLAKQG
jgi:hypothetical protein